MQQMYAVDHNRSGLKTFKRRLFKLYLPLILIGSGLIFHFGIQKTTSVSAAPAVTRIVYSGTYTSSGNASTSAPAISASQSPLCSPDTDFQPAGAFTSSQPGLVQQIDTPYAHKMYGTTAAELSQLSRQCPLAITGDNEPYVNAYTSYWMGWQYSFEVDATGQCQVLNPRVLIHIREALPVWQTPNSNLAAQWQAYAAAVNTHENGHIKLVQQAGAQLLSALQNLPAQNCGSIKQSADNLGNDYTNRLAQANAAYDVFTQHGATQGAIVP